jgi:hypothetical protein
MPTPPPSEARLHRHVLLPHLPSPLSCGLETASPMLTPPALEPLGFRPCRFSQLFSLLIPTFSDLIASLSLAPHDHSRHHHTYRSLSYRYDPHSHHHSLQHRRRTTVPSIYDATHLVQHAITRSLSDGYLQAYRLTVIGSSLP